MWSGPRRGLPGPGGGSAWSQGGWCVWSGGVPDPGVPGPGYPPCGQTHACKNITLATTSSRPVKIWRLNASVFVPCSLLQTKHVRL